MTTTTTLLEAANNVLLYCNERPLANLLSPLGQQVKLAIKTALIMFSEANDWPWLHQRINADAWANGIATLPSNVTAVRSVAWYNGYKDVQLRPLHYSAFQAITDYEGTPLYWTQGAGLTLVKPYPEVLERPNVWFYAKSWITIPDSETGVFAMPEREFTAVMFLAASQFAVQHLEDAGLYQMLRGEYELLMQQFRQTYAPRNTNVYPGYRLRSYGRQF